MAGDLANTTQFWGLVLNFQFTQTGGCTTQVRNGDEVLWVFDAFSKTHVLKLTGPASATTGVPTTVKVVDGQNGSPAAGATVNGVTTDADGNAAVSFASAGVYRLKAERADSVRSNALTLCVDPPGADPCTSGDKTAPSVLPSLPGKRIASETGKSRTMLISWQASDAAGAGVSHYAVDVKRALRRRQRRARPMTAGSRSSSRTALTVGRTSAATPAAPTSSASPRSTAPPTAPSSSPTRSCSRSTIATAAC